VVTAHFHGPLLAIVSDVCSCSTRGCHSELIPAGIPLPVVRQVPARNDSARVQSGADPQFGHGGQDSGAQDGAQDAQRQHPADSATAVERDLETAS
jgi:hypothetical protein